MSSKYDHRIHLICAPADAEAVRVALEKSLPGWLSWAPVGEVDLEAQAILSPRLWIDSGQWTEAQAALLAEACAGLPVRVVRGVALGLLEEGAVVVDKGDAVPAREDSARRTIERAVEEWVAERAEGAAAAEEIRVR